MEEAEDAQKRKEDVMRIVRWGLGGLALAAMTWWSVSVVSWCVPVVYTCEYGTVVYGGCGPLGWLLALAPWVIGGLVLFSVLGVRWWRSRGTEEAEDTQERKRDVMRIVQWGLAGLALAVMACGSVLVVWWWDPVVLGGCGPLGLLLAWAPWIIGLVLFIVLVVWWDSEGPEAPEDTEEDAG